MRESIQLQKSNANGNGATIAKLDEEGKNGTSYSNKFNLNLVTS